MVDIIEKYCSFTSITIFQSDILILVLDYLNFNNIKYNKYNKYNK
jgi:hypothetical protein